MNAHLPAPTSGAAVASYIALAVFLALVLLGTLFGMGPALTSHLGALRTLVGVRPR